MEGRMDWWWWCVGGGAGMGFQRCRKLPNLLLCANLSNNLLHCAILYLNLHLHLRAARRCWRCWRALAACGRAARAGGLLAVPPMAMAMHAMSGAPMMLYGYGSYGACMEPSFAPSRLPLLDRGVVWAITHIRGGSEMGRHW